MWGCCCAVGCCVLSGAGERMQARAPHACAMTLFALVFAVHAHQWQCLGYAFGFASPLSHTTAAAAMYLSVLLHLCLIT
jgi:hypothetical protein